MSNLLAVTGQPAHAQRLAQQALSGPAGGDEWQRARLVLGRGLARTELGDARAAADYSEAASLFQAARGWVPVSCHVNQADIWAKLGRLDRARDATARARHTALRQASVLDVRSTDVETAWHQYWSGGVAGPAATVAQWHTDAGAGLHFRSASCLCLGARLATADRDLVVAGRLADLALTRAIRAGYTEIQVAALVITALTGLRRGHPVRQARLLAEQALALAAGRFLPAEVAWSFRC